ncbi:PAS/PAC sensor signal transduction histidine kinase [Stanieria cyanosphaera PCC 7437]|uniref:histidine kinase n=1 Tax=Stanieria cyanosphaera (strain ATCC 29371 / PCC 7437) TaxID=111780 RepID=K9XY92_STAC7|nr:PAS domain-containing sensor histidine kinase [Stanieria cyanosphaera]AFZ37071.1 PAS/PAC sensor signal transduction histidine kinase [Stanieria cyanosphaera PCC 7437]
MNQLLIFDQREYVIINQNLIVLQRSTTAQKFAESPQTLVPGQDIRLSFPELIGLENVLTQILNQEQEFFSLETIARHVNNKTNLYFNLLIKKLGNNLIIFLEDTTEIILLKQSLVQQINEAEVLVSTLKRFEDCTKKILTSMGDVLFITTPSGEIEQINQAAKKVFGYNQNELVAKTIDFIVKNENFDHEKVYNYLLKNRNKVQKIDAICQTKSGELREIEFSCSIVQTEIKEFFNCVYIGRDITARKQAETEILQALQKEKELREIKSRFISLASHEFRNPLSSILIAANFLAENKNNISQEDWDFYLKTINTAAQNMQSLVEDILVISKTEEGKLTFNPGLLNLNKFCQRLIKELEITANKKNILFSTNVEHLVIWSDEKILKLIINNLLSNAIKYSPQEENIEFKILYFAEQEIVQIIIQDYGIGIPVEARKHLFDSFYRANNVGDIPGTGLGLSIVKKAVDLHGGKIELNSKLGLGTIITVILPVNHQSC